MQMKKVEDKYDVGVIVGRFQVPDLHDVHKALIQHVCDEHDKVIIFLGLSPLMVTTENPLDFEARKQMILKEFPDVNLHYIKDMHDDDLWSRKLDEQISDVTTPAQSVVLYGGRDSFMDRYSGKHATRELEQDTFISGSEIRKAVSRRSVRASADFRAGVVWAAYSKFPTTYTCVDIAIFNEDETKILLARKPTEKLYRLVGGFSDPESSTFEADARREVHEEAGIEITDPEYLGSFQIDDWRYRSEIDKIKTLLFKAHHMFGAPRADDDVAEVRWFDVANVTDSLIVPQHRVLVKRALEA